MSDIPNKDWKKAQEHLSAVTQKRLDQSGKRGDMDFNALNDLINLKTRYFSGERTQALYIQMMSAK